MHTDMLARHAVTARVLRHRRLSAAITYRFGAQLPASIDRADLLAAANVGLITAAQRFEAGYGVPFGAYARLRIIGSVRDELRRYDLLSRTERRRRNGVAQDGVLPVRAGELLTVQRGRVPVDVTLLACVAPSVEDQVVTRDRLWFVMAAIRALPEPLARAVPWGEDAVPLRILALAGGVSVATVSRRRMTARKWLETAVAFYDGAAAVDCSPQQSGYLRRIAGFADTAVRL